jgi:hypothetical protein
MTEPGSPAPKDSLLRTFISVFAAALVLYIIVYGVVEHRRVRQGPWRVTFTANADELPAILINQLRLGITNVEIAFARSAPVTNIPVTLQFDQATPVPFDVPYGKCIFLDTTFLPGTVTMQLFGFEIELLPRVLIVDRAEVPWSSRQPIVLGRP